MDHPGSNTGIWSRGQEISNAAHDEPAKNNVPTLPQPPRADAGLSTTAAIAAKILLGHYNVDGTRRVNNYDVADSIRSLAAVGLHVSPDKALVSSSCSGLITPTSSTTATTKDVFQSDSSDLDMLDKLPTTHKMTGLTARLLHGLAVPNKQQSNADLPTLTSSSDIIKDFGMPTEAPGPASKFPWDTDLTGGGLATANKLGGAKANGAGRGKKLGCVWTPEEDAKFLEALRTSGQNWTDVAKYLGTKTKAEVRYHARRYMYGKVSDALEAPSAALTAFEYFVQSNGQDRSVKEMFPGATPTGRRYLLDSKFRTLQPSIKNKFFQIAEKDAARYDWEKKVYLAIRDYHPPVPHSVAIQKIRAEIRSVFPNITKEGEQRLLKERAKHLKPPGVGCRTSKRARRAKKKL